MVNGLGVLGWGVGGIEAEAAMLGQPISMLIPEVVGFKLTGKLPEGATATDLVLTVTQMLRKKGVVGKFVEFFGPGLDQLPLADRATIGNMAPEYGATCGFFPVDERDARLPAPHRPRRPSASRWSRPTPRRRACGATTACPIRCSPTRWSSTSRTVEPSLAGPKRPQDRVALTGAKASFEDGAAGARRRQRRPTPRVPVEGMDYELDHGDVVIAAITSCTNTSNPACCSRAGLVAQEGGRASGLKPQAVGQDLAGARLAGGHRLSGEGRPAGRSRRARLQPGRLRLHHLHRQFRPAARRRSPRRSTTATWWSPRCCPATATSRAASTPR